MVAAILFVPAKFKIVEPYQKTRVLTYSDATKHGAAPATTSSRP